MEASVRALLESKESQLWSFHTGAGWVIQDVITNDYQFVFVLYFHFIVLALGATLDDNFF